MSEPLFLDRALKAFNAKLFTEKHGGYKESRSPTSHEYLLPCPYCMSERLRWNHPTKQTWICWGCRKTGASIDLIALFEKCSYMQAMDFVQETYHGGDADWTVKEIEQPDDAPRVLYPVTWPQGMQTLGNAPSHEAGWDYLRRRGIDPAQALAYGLGFGVGGKLRGYVGFPVFMRGQFVYWQARATWDPPPQQPGETRDVYKLRRKAWIKETHYIKTRNPPMTGTTAGGGEVLFNFDRAYHSPHVVLCEGPIDAMHVGDHCVALLGKIAQPAKLALLRELPARTITIYLDSGEEERASAMAIAAELSHGREIRIATPPEGYDAGDLPWHVNAQVIAAAQPYQANDFYRSKLGHL